MANERRLRQNFISGTITNNPLAAGDTTLNSANLANLAAVTSTSHIAIVLNPLGDTAYSTGPEIVYVTAHTALATSATIARGKEGTTGIQHATGTPWVVAGVASDLPGNAYGIWTRTSNQSINNVTDTTVTFDGETVDTDGFLTPTSGTITIPAGMGGWYAYQFRGTLSAATSTATAVRVLVNGTTNVDNRTIRGSDSAIAISGTVLLAAGDTLAVQVFQSSGGALNLNPATLNLTCLYRG